MEGVNLRNYDLTFNRTSLESKLYREAVKPPLIQTFNRTSLESKLEFGAIEIGIRQILLIEPVWNRNR